MITDSNGRTVVLITDGVWKNRLGVITAKRPGDETVSVDIGGGVVQKGRDQFRAIAVGDVLRAA